VKGWSDFDIHRAAIEWGLPEEFKTLWKVSFNLQNTGYSDVVALVKAWSNKLEIVSTSDGDVVQLIKKSAEKAKAVEELEKLGAELEEKYGSLFDKIDADSSGNLSATELTDAMVKLKSSPGSQNGTGMLQSVIALKVREVYEKLGLQSA